MKNSFFCLIKSHFTTRARNFCSKGPRGSEICYAYWPPSPGTDYHVFVSKFLSDFFFGSFFQLFQKKIIKKILFSPTYYPFLITSCSKGPSGLKFVMRIDHPHAGPTITFLIFKFDENCSFFQLLKKSVFKINNLINPTHCPAL